MAGFGGDVFYGRTELQSEFYKQLPAGCVRKEGGREGGKGGKEGREGVGEGGEGGREGGSE